MSRTPKKLGLGLLTGLTAALTMSLVLLLLRYFFGVATPSELVGDRIAPLLTVERFIYLLDRFGGYNNLKQIGVVSVIAGQLIVGALGGALYTIALHPSAKETQPKIYRGRLVVTSFVVLLWILSLLLLWPVMGTSYSGLAQTKATVVNSSSWLMAYSIYGVTLVLLGRLILAANKSENAVKQPTARRALLVSGVGALIAVAAGGLLTRLYKLATFSYDGTRYKGAEVQAITPNDRFYVVTKNVIDPEVSLSSWRLEITGLVERPKTYRFEDLAALSSISQETTLRCISNQVGDGLMSNAIWKGVPLRNLIEAAGAKQGVVEVLLHGVDNYTDTFSMEKAMEPTTLIAYEMNGKVIPARHGFPVRVIVPGVFGEKSIKWVTRIELLDHEAKGFYEQQGWGPNFVVPTTARFDVPSDKEELKLAIAEGGVQLRGVAHAGDRGVSRVEVSVDNGKSWNEAKLEHTQTPLAWVLWAYEWQPTEPAEYKLIVRAADGKGELQTAQERGTVPEGATGYHSITVGVAT